MNKYFKYIVLGICTMNLLSCNGWLKEDSGDLLIPKNVLEFIPVLYGEGYPRSFNDEARWFAVMSDDVEMGAFEKDASGAILQSENFDSSYGGEARYVFRWYLDIEERLTDNFWDRRYRNILGCNTIISQLPDMEYSEVQTGKYNHLAAQAYALRAYHYFCLINTYALPWSAGDLDKPGVVWRNSPEISTDPRPRETIGAIYAFINEDLAKAAEYMITAETSANKHLIGPAALMLLQTRVALFQEKWDEVIEVGEKFIRDYPTIYNLNTANEARLGGTGSTDPYIFDLATNNEIIFTFGNNSSVYSFLSNPATLSGFGFRTSRPYSEDPDHIYPNKPLISCYEEGDLRQLAYFERDGLTTSNPFRYYFPVKYRASGSSNYRENWRTVEVYLNLAEAYARKATTVSEEAITLLNRLRINRIRADEYQDVTTGDFASKQALVAFIWEERRRELCFEEGIRLWDLRRQGMPQLEHRLYTTKTEYETYILPQGSNNYTLAIPRSEVLFNNDIVENPRDHITPQ